MSAEQKNILVIGSNSFLGAALIRKLKDKGSVTGVFHQSTDLHLPDDVSYIQVNEMTTLEDKFHVVYLISAYVPASGETVAQRLFEVNVRLAEQVTKQFRSAHIVLASSVSVYGSPAGTISEHSPSIQVNAYGLSKLWAETIVQQHPAFSIHRISSMYGENMKTTTFLPVIIKHALTKGEIALKGNGQRKQNYVHVEDVADSMIASSVRPFNTVFLSVGERSYSNAEIAAMVKEQLPSVHITFEGTDEAVSYVYEAGFTYTKLRWECRTEMETGINQLFTWIKKGF